MADSVEDIVEYYVNLLIIQYNNKPNARATIESFVRSLIANGILFDIRDAYAVETAIGVQLDVIGKYVGVNRFYKIQDLVDFFALTDYVEVDPDSLDKFGFTDYADFEDYQYNGTLNYKSVLSQTNRLEDDDFRVLIYLKILQNNINHSHKSIDDAVFDIFGSAIRPDSLGDMEMYYFIDENLSAIIKASLAKNLLPRPMGVQLTLITGVSEPFFGFATYTNPAENPFTLGFTDYAAYDTSEGQMLIYNQVEVQ
jgi:hypothetical protein